MHMAVVVCFQNEEQYLSTTLSSLARQQRLPDRLVLVDDGPTDRSSEMALAFVTEHPFARYVRLPVRPRTRDRLAQAAVVRAFQQGVEVIDIDWDIVAKMDGDLDLP